MTNKNITQVGSETIRELYVGYCIANNDTVYNGYMVYKWRSMHYVVNKFNELICKNVSLYQVELKYGKLKTVEQGYFNQLPAVVRAEVTRSGS